MRVSKPISSLIWIALKLFSNARNYGFCKLKDYWQFQNPICMITYLKMSNDTWFKNCTFKEKSKISHCMTDNLITVNTSL